MSPPLHACSCRHLMLHHIAIALQITDVALFYHEKGSISRSLGGARDRSLRGGHMCMHPISHRISLNRRHM